MPSFAPNTLYYVAVTLTNNQAGATGSNFPTLVNWNSNTYNAKEASDLKNTEWQDGTGTIMKSWLQGPASNTSTSTNSFILLPNSITGSGGTQVIYLCFYATSTNRFDGSTTGCAPQLTVNGSAYGALDNGATVPYTTLYANFAGTSQTGFSVTGASAAINNGWTIPAQAGGTTQQSILSTSTFGLTSGQTLDMIVKAPTGSSGAHNNLPAGYVLNNINFVGWSMDGEASIVDNIRTAGSDNPGTLAITAGATYHVISITWTATTGATFNLDYGTAETITQTTLPAAHSVGAFGAASGTYNEVDGYWMGIRPTAPSNIYPSASFGSITTISTTVNMWAL